MLRAVACAGLAVLAAACSSPCDYAHGGCDPGQVCARVDEQKTECVPAEVLDAPVRAPFADGVAFTCSQGAHSPLPRTHSYRHDVYAIDLASAGKDGAVVVAPVDGQAWVYDGCEERDASATAKNDSRCGQGYGNHVKIWDGQTMVLVGHLSRVTIKDGLVQAGQPIGTEGVSGAAGSRHVHLSITRPVRGVDAKKLLSTPGLTGRVPVRFRMTLREREAGKVVVRSEDELTCADDPAARTAYWP